MGESSNNIPILNKVSDEAQMLHFWAFFYYGVGYTHSSSNSLFLHKLV